ncbi:MAG: NAD-dependent isocitrate dehydrogenase [Methanobrevibacter sp.]|jgi:3-isopropylmalate dehydrogenase|nr:NAD-dependent isocitrate dehydrogenase [Candidatus Methanovirga aequatorialis]
MYNIAIIPGDGIGKEVMSSTLEVLDGLDLDLSYEYGKAGDECFKKNGVALLDETIDLVKNSDVCLFGAAGETAADVIVKLRQIMDLFVNLRPVKSYPGTDSLFKDLDFIIVRENTEGMYVGEEEYTEDGAIAKRIITKEASERICEFAFKYAKDNNKKKVTAVHKANVLKKTDGLFKKTFYEMAAEYPDIEAEDYYVDATAMYLLTRPQSFDVIVTTNLFGDILSDEGAGLVGGLGLIPSGNIGKNNALFEPVHGSAPDIAGKGLANPTAMLLSAVMMLNYLDEQKSARLLNSAIFDVLKEGKRLTPDMGGNSSTMEMAKEVKSKLLERMGS